MRFSKWIDKFVVQAFAWQIMLGLSLVLCLTVGALVVWYVLSVGTAPATSSAGGAAIAQSADAHFAVKALFTTMIRVLVLTLCTGFFTRWLQGRREHILTGAVSYPFDRNYALVVGYDFQVRPLVKHLLAEAPRRDVVVVTAGDAEPVYRALLTELAPQESHRLFVLRRDFVEASTWRSFTLSGAAAIYLIGDEGAKGRDGLLLKTQALLAEKGDAEPLPAAPVNVYLHLATSEIYREYRTRELALDRAVKRFALHVYNYYESWAWSCWCAPETAAQPPCRPLNFRPAAKRHALFVLGFGPMGRALVDMAASLYNTGAEGQHAAITVFSDDPAEREPLPPADALEALPEVTIRHEALSPFSPEAREALLAATQDTETALTVALVDPDPDRSLRLYASLPVQLHSEGVSVMLWMPMDRRSLPELAVPAFGMTDLLPWLDARREALGARCNYFYSVNDSNLQWNAEKAAALWREVPRWRRWSSVCAADTLREKRLLPPDALARAEHNRWWTERLLAGWRLGPRDNARRLHPDLVPFEQLTPAVQDLDRVVVKAIFGA